MPQILLVLRISFAFEHINIDIGAHIVVRDVFAILGTSLSVKRSSQIHGTSAQTLDTC
jgi:hypothetical protein